MDYDFVIVGAGIAGASVAAELAWRGRTLLLEKEEIARLCGQLNITLVAV